MTNHQEIILAAVLSVSIVISNSALFNVLKVDSGNDSKKMTVGRFFSLILCLSFKLNSLVILYLLYTQRATLSMGVFLGYFCLFLSVLVLILGLIWIKLRAT